MKIYLNRQPVQGPWGGGNKAVTKLAEFLTTLGHQVVFRLEENIDIIFCFDPRPNDFGEWYQNFLNYKNLHRAKIIQRVGDVGTHNKPQLTELVKQAVQYSDHIIFPSEWAKEYINYSGTNCSIIYNGPLKVFHEHKKNEKINETVNIITHHWSTNPKKGFKYYQLLDDHVSKNKDINFTFIGRLPENFYFKSINYIDATGDNQYLAKKLSEQDIYLTASEEEAGANHVLEGLAAGIPIIYHNNGGSINNYCHKYGLEYSTFDELLLAIKEIKENYNSYKEKAIEYTRTINDVIKQYVRIVYEV